MGWSNNYFSLIIIVVSPSGFSGLFVYKPSPGAGNLVLAIAAEAGTDPYGNAYQNGLTVIDNAGGNSGIWLPSGASFESGITNIGTLVVGSGGGAFIEAIFQGPSPAGTPTNRVAVYLLSETESLGNDAFGALVFQDNSGNLDDTLTWGVAGIVAVGSITGQEPGQSVPTFETWHDMTPASGFSAGTPIPQYRLLADSSRVELRGIVTLAANQVSGAIWWDIPPGYQPVQVNQEYFTPNNLSGAAYPASIMSIQDNAEAVLTCAGTSGDGFRLDGIAYDLD